MQNLGDDDRNLGPPPSSWCLSSGESSLHRQRRRLARADGLAGIIWYRIRYHMCMDTATLIRRARASSGLSLRHLAERAGTSHSTISAYEAGRIDPSLLTFERIIRAAGFRLAIDLVPLVGDPVHNRGDELAQALELAEQFPARHTPDLRFPRFAVQ